jgi:4-hydroxy-tetrahydrodipicolinate synthase
MRAFKQRGVHGVWLLGGAGEGALLAADARRHAVEAALAELGGALPLAVGISGASTQHVLSRYRALADLPVTGFFVTPPYVYGCEQIEVVEFYRVLSVEIERPLIVYNNPDLARTSLTPATVAELLALPGIVGVKDSSGDLATTQAFITKAAARDLSVLQGYDTLAAASLLAGGAGIVSALACFVPSLMLELWHAAAADDAATAMARQRRASEILDLLAWEPTDGAYIRGIKMALARQGLCTDTLVHPFKAASDDERNATSRVLEGLEEFRISEA